MCFLIGLQATNQNNRSYWLVMKSEIVARSSQKNEFLETDF